MWIHHDNPASALRSQSGDAMALKSVDASGRLTGLLFEMTVRQSYRNETGHTLETVYTFPLAWGAVLLGLYVEIGGKRLAGVVVERQEAERSYEEAVADGDTPVMLEKSADGLYTANLGNLKPGEEAVIEYRYAQLLRFEQGRTRLVVPTTIAPRYGDAESQGGIRPHESVGSDLLVEYPFKFTLALVGDVAAGTVESPSHRIGTRCENGATVVTLDRNAWLDRDFVLTVGGLTGRSLAAVAMDGEESVVMASFCPEIPGASRTTIALKILVDCSGSMGGDSIGSARQALHRVLAELGQTDRISYSRFGSTVQHLFDRMVPANDKAIAKAARHIESTDATMGGTEINSALHSVFGLQGGNERTDVLLITDGEVWDNEAMVEAARQSGHRIFAVGVGSAPAETLLRRLAEATGGACELVAPNEDIEAAIVRMFRRIRLPQATHFKVEWSTHPRWATALQTALFDGEMVHSFAAFDELPQSVPVLIFETADGAVGRCVAPTLVEVDTDALVRLAGNERVRQESGNEAAALALRYQLVTDQTSLFLVHVREEEDKAADLPHLQKIAHMQAAGWGGMGSVVASSSPAMVLDSLDVAFSMSTVMTSRRARYSTGFDDSVLEPLDIPAFLRTEAPQPIYNYDRQALTTLLEEFLATVNRQLTHPEDLDDLIRSLLGSISLKLLSVVVAAIEHESTGRKEAWSVFALWAESQVGQVHQLNRHAARVIRSITMTIPAQHMEVIFVLVAKQMDRLSSDGWPPYTGSAVANEAEAPHVDAVEAGAGLRSHLSPDLLEGIEWASREK